MNIFKWELKKRVYQIRFFVLALIILIAVLYLLIPLPSEVKYGNIVREVLVLISIAAGITGAYIVVVYPTLSIIIDFRREYCFLEKMHSRPFIITAAARLLLNILSVLIGTGLLILASKAFEKFNTENMGYLTINLSISYAKLIFNTAVLSPIIALFSFIAALSIPAFNKNSFKKIPIIYAVCGIFIMILSIPIFKKHTFLKATVIYAICGITFFIDEVPIAQGVIVTILFIISSLLYDVRYEVDY